jgi:cyclopropane-fatty-acyl-phospholipid synthase
VSAGDARVRAARSLFERLAPVLRAPVQVRLWDGSRVALDPAAATSALEIEISSPQSLGALLRRPNLERLLALYTTGAIELRGGSPLDLLDAFEAGRSTRRERRASRTRLADALALLRAALPLLVARGRAASLAHAFPEDETGGGASAVEFHYDLGNDFYALFLDPAMQYSCAYFTDWKNPLSQAQGDKLEMICRKLRLAPGERLLDVGCGWGGLVLHAAAHHGVRAYGITLSRPQQAFASERVRALGLEDRVTLALRDYTDLAPERDGRFDKIASVGMIEHVEVADQPRYFERLAAVLEDRGLLLCHGITRRAKASGGRGRRSRPEKRLMLRYVFPGHELDDLGHMLASLETRGFEVRDVESWREHYALTARHWCQRLAARSDDAERLVGRARTRTWLAYLAGVSGAFRDGSLAVHQVLASLSRAKGASRLPPTRDDLYRP